jgi:hypothetical protein
MERSKEGGSDGAVAWSSVFSGVESNGTQEGELS